MIRRLLLVALVLTGCTVQPVSAPSSPSSAPTPAPTTEPAGEPEVPDVSCGGLPMSVISKIVGTWVPVPAESTTEDGLTSCKYHHDMGMTSRIEFTTESDEASFAQRREAYESGPYSSRFREIPDFYDEGYQTVEGFQSMARSLVVARQGSVEVWVMWSGPRSEGRPESFIRELVSAVFKRQ